MKKLILPIVLVIILLSLQGVKYGLPYLLPNVLPPPSPDPITMAVAIYESERDDAIVHYDQHQVMVGKTSQALRGQNKWRQYDKDHTPEKYADLLKVAEEKQAATETFEPWLGIYHEDNLDWDGAMPDSDAGLKKVINENGGL